VAKPLCTDPEFIALWQSMKGSATEVARALETDTRGVLRRRRSLEKKLGAPLLSHSSKSPDRAILGPENTYIRRNQINIENGTLVMFTDAHLFPGYRTTAQRALLKLLPDLKPQVIVDNGDSFDGGQISRHDRIGWDKRPTVKEELDTNSDYHAEVESVSPGCSFWWNWGNHDMRFPTRLASKVSEYEGVHGFRLEDHFPRWKFGISLTINPDAYTPTLIKHRYHGGVHADWNNVMKAGINICTGHDHQLGVRRFCDKRGTRFGARAGTLSDAGLPIFDYQEDNPSQQASGFLVCTFHKSRLLCPETVEVISENEVSFRGSVISV
jgi:calcineurin-like phosphoesterase family protein